MVAGLMQQPASARYKFSHRRAIAVLAVGVLAAHLWVTHEVSMRMQELAPPELTIKRMEATYVTEVKLSAPPVTAAALPRPAEQTAGAAPARKKRSPKPVKAASAPDESASQAKVMAPLDAASQVADASSAAVPPLPAWKESAPKGPQPDPAYAANAASAPAGPTFVWPKATKVNYKLEGYFRGPFEGTASVEWVREGSRYQVRLDSSLPFANISMISEGVIEPNGLSPKRYESLFKMALKAPKAAAVSFDDQEVVLGNGDRVPRPPEVQDPVSTLIHLAYQFISQPQLLKPGNTVVLPLAYTKKIEPLAFDVINEEVLHTDLGDIPALHVKPRRMLQDKNDLVGETWFAPSLQYLPIRILTHMGEITLDMKMIGAPQQTPGDDAPLPPSKGGSATKADPPY